MSQSDFLLLHELFDGFPSFNRREGLLIVVNESPARVNDILKEEAIERTWPTVAVNLELANALRDVRPTDRDKAADRFIQSKVRIIQNGPIVLVEIDLLFAPELYIDPIRLLTNASQLCPLAVAWPGSWDGQTLSYATPAHGHHRHWSRLSADIRNVR